MKTLEEIALGLGFTVAKPKATFDGFSYIGAKASDAEFAPLPPEMLHWLAPANEFPSEERAAEVVEMLVGKFLEGAKALGHDVCLIRRELSCTHTRNIEPPGFVVNRVVEGWIVYGRLTTWPNESLTTANRSQAPGQG